MGLDNRTTLFRMLLQLRWRDLDAFEHVNNSTFLTYLEEARVRWFDSIDGPWVTDEFAPLLAAVQLNYRRPLAYPSQIAVELYLDKVGTSSLTIGHAIASADGAALYCDGNAVMVWVDRASGRPRPLPESIRRAVSL